MTVAGYKALMMQKKKNKHHAVRTTVDGIEFQSKREAERWCTLRFFERTGEISNLRRQVPFELLPAQWEVVETDELYKKGPKKGQKKVKRVCVEHGVVYYADFVYERNGKTIVEDAKGQRLPDYIIKRKLMLWVHKIKIKEV